jgi:hypothetical protein
MAAHQPADHRMRQSWGVMEGERALSDKPEPACEGCKSEAFRPPTDATRPLRQNDSVW